MKTAQTAPRLTGCFLHEPHSLVTEESAISDRTSITSKKPNFLLLAACCNGGCSIDISDHLLFVKGSQSASANSLFQTEGPIWIILSSESSKATPAESKNEHSELKWVHLVPFDLKTWALEQNQMLLLTLSLCFMCFHCVCCDWMLCIILSCSCHTQAYSEVSVVWDLPGVTVGFLVWFVKYAKRPWGGETDDRIRAWCKTTSFWDTECILHARYQMSSLHHLNKSL